MKTYSTKANARRAGRQQLGTEVIEGQDFELVEIDGQYGYQPTSCDLLDKSLTDAEFEKPAIVYDAKHVAKAIKQRNKSSITNPVQHVWAIANSMPSAKRKEIIAACVELGVAFFTARTQYQKWRRDQQISSNN